MLLQVELESLQYLFCNYIQLFITVYYNGIIFLYISRINHIEHNFLLYFANQPICYPAQTGKYIKRYTRVPCKLMHATQYDYRHPTYLLCSHDTSSL